MKKKNMLIFLGGVTVVGVFFLLFFKIPEWEMRDEAKSVINKIEIYHELNGYYPEDLHDIGIDLKEEGPIYYQKSKEDDSYNLWIGLRLGDSKMYSSKEDEWE